MPALNREIDPDEPMSRPADPAPQPAITTTKGMIAFAGHGLPHTNAALGAPHLDGAGHIRGRLCPPIEAVATEIDQATATGQEVLEGAHHPHRVIFWVLPSNNNAIGQKRVDTFLMQIMVSHHVMRHVDGAQPLVDIIVRHPARGARTTHRRVHQHELAWPRVEHWPILADQ